MVRFSPADNAINYAELKRINQGSRARFTTTSAKAATKSLIEAIIAVRVMVIILVLYQDW